MTDVDMELVREVTRWAKYLAPHEDEGAIAGAVIEYLLRAELGSMKDTSEDELRGDGVPPTGDNVL